MSAQGGNNVSQGPSISRPAPVLLGDGTLAGVLLVVSAGQRGLQLQGQGQDGRDIWWTAGWPATARNLRWAYRSAFPCPTVCSLINRTVPTRVAAAPSALLTHRLRALAAQVVLVIGRQLVIKLLLGRQSALEDVGARDDAATKGGGHWVHAWPEWVSTRTGQQGRQQRERPAATQRADDLAGTGRPCHSKPPPHAFNTAPSPKPAAAQRRCCRCMSPLPLLQPAAAAD